VCVISGAIISFELLLSFGFLLAHVLQVIETEGQRGENETQTNYSSQVV
jgi:hypothetical protein